MQEYSIRIVVLDYYMSSPLQGLDVLYSEFRSSSITKVPVLRCFGSTPSGEKMCLHIHGVFPYIYIPYDGSGDANSLMYQIALDLDKAINISMNQAASNVQHVYKVQLVSGMPMYGFHPKRHQFFKIYLYNPLLINKVSTLLQNEQILGKKYQPHEAHINFTLQFMIDYNLHGMSNLKVYNVNFRGNPEDITNKDLHLPLDINKITVCQLEGDVIAENIINRQEIVNGGLSVNPGISSLWEDERQRRRLKNRDSQLTHFLQIHRVNVSPTNSHMIYKKALLDRLAILADDRKIDEIDISVYPAEIPEGADIQNASIIDLHTPSSLEISLDQTVSLDDFKLSVDANAQDLVDILENLGQNVNENLEEDSILSQIVNDEDDSIEELDMTMPLETMTTPHKIIAIKENISDEWSDDNSCDITLIPQLDGSVDDLGIQMVHFFDNIQNSTVEGANSEKINDKSIFTPFLNVSCSLNESDDRLLFVKLEKLDRNKDNMSLTGNKMNSHTRASQHMHRNRIQPLKVLVTSSKVKKQSQQKRKDEVKLFFHKIQKLNKTNKLQKIMKIISQKENCVNKLLKTSKPIFNIISPDKYKGKETFLKYLLDGANDSSSEDEIPSKKRKVYRRKNVFTRYAQHHVSAASSSKGNNHENLLGSKEDILVSSSHSMGYKKADAVVQINNSNSVKRRLTFYPALTQPNGSSCGDATCKYSSFPSSLVMTRHITSDSENSDIKENNTNSENSSESDIFSASENEHSNSFFEKHCAHLPKPRVETFIKVTPKYTTSVPLQLYKICTDNVPISKEKLNDTNRTSQSFIKAQLKLYTPVNKPPSYVEVKSSLDILKIPHVKQQEPFYNNVEDVTGSVDIGYNVLKIKSKTTANVSEFDSSYNGLHPYRKRVVEGNSSSKWNKNNIKNLTLSFCQDKTVIIKPIQLAPSVKKVTSWINKYSKDLSLVENMVKKYKISIPLSNSDHIEDNNLTTFSCTPIFSGSDSSENTEESSVSANISKKTSLRKSVLNEHEIIYNRSCEISGVSQNNTFGFDQSVQNFQNAKTIIIQQNLTILVIELHIRTRGDFKPNPELDAICALFYSIINDVAESHPKEKKGKGVLVVNDIPLSLETKCPPLLNGINCDCEIMYVDSEENLINEFLKLLQYWDPDILAGYETQMLSWGYLVERAYILNINLVQLLGRSKISMKGFKEQPESENITGRVILDVWRLMRPEIALQSYSFESIVYHILHKRVPMYAFKDLSFWWDHKTNLYRHHTVHYYIFRVEAVLELLDKLDLIGRTSELARLFGIQFFEVLSRGSQFRVESMMLRLAKPLNFIPVSPSVTQRAQMKAPEYIPLVMEPESKLYNDPLIVLDFQSMYPSIIIAYNYCFTTCLGRVECLGKNGQFKFGATNLKISRKVVERLVKRDLLNFSPCGVAFVKCEVRDGILPRMLREILDTRLMVKNSMKENKDNKVLQKVLHNRQLGLKLIANVTYGYTAANFSGRMCCVEVGDSVVSKGRETLQRAIALVDNTLEWGAKVVYGDTDSLFVLVPGRSKEAAFEVGEKIATAVTNDNPDPIKLKLEKIYQPSILQTKKRYVGYMYESPDQKEPIFDAKGIETVRRDGCPAVAKILEKCLRLLFETKDVSLIKRYVLKQFTKIIAGRASIQDLTFAKEYRGSSGYKAGSCVPALELSRKWTAIDKRNEPRCGERVPYIIVSGPPGLPLIRLVKSPRDLLDDPSLKPNAMYYISKVIIPPLNRCFSLIGADINTWFSQMPRKINHILPTSSPSKKNTISQYFATSSCASCEDLTQTGLCDICSEKPQETYITLMEKLRMWEQNSNKTIMFCKSCTSFVGDIKCISLDCPILYRRIQTSHDVQQTTYIRQLLNSAESLF